MNCGFTDIVLLMNGQYKCVKCGKIMNDEWKHRVLNAGLKLPKRVV